MKAIRLSWMLALVLPIAARADTFKLADGTTVEGALASETEHEYVVKIEYAGGTITREERIAKSNVVEIVRLTPEQAMERAWTAIHKYRLDPLSSFTVSQYNQTISNAFLPFLRQYPDSPHATELKQTISEWETERDLVAAGQARYADQWLPAERARKLLRRDYAQRELRLGEDLLARDSFERAIQHLHAAAQITDAPEIANEAREREAYAYKLWLLDLGRLQQELNDDLAEASQPPAASPSAPKLTRPKPLRSHFPSWKGERKLGQDSPADVKSLGQSAQADAAKASDAAFREYTIKMIHQQQDELAKKIADVQARAAQVGPAIPVTTTAAAPGALPSASPATVSTAEEAQQSASTPAKAPEVTQSIAGLVKKYWIPFAGIFGIVIWLIYRSVSS